MTSRILPCLVSLSVLLSIVTAKPQQTPPIPDFGKQYGLMGTLSLPYAELNEPVIAYVDLINNRSRINYYHGIVSMLMLGGKGDYGEAYTLAYVTTYNDFNKRSCFKVDGTSDGKIVPQIALPDLSDYKFIGRSTYIDFRIQIFEKVEKIGSKTNTYTMWVTDDSQYPLRFEMMGYDAMFGSHYDKYTINYKVFNKGPPDESLFVIPSTMKCTGFPGPGDKHLASMNPMLELVNRKTSYVDDMFEEFKQKHSKSYNNEKEHSKRKHHFLQNLRYIDSKNRAGLTYTLAVNHLADYSEAELKVLRGYKSSGQKNNGLPFDESLIHDSSIPESKDWRLEGAVTQVKDQAVCGSCWSFGTTGTIEGAYFLKTGNLVRLSQQELMDCSWGEGNNGCDGGEDFRAYDWIMKTGGLTSEDSYGAYLAIDGKCHYNSTKPVLNLKGYVNVTSGSEDALKAAIFKFGPVSVAIDAAHKSLSFYANGVYYEEKCGSGPDSLDHAVLAVGYGELNGEPYWLVKNSWSTYWGNNGYVLMSRKNNNCGVTTSPTYVIIE
ncbi:digestive cysteine proteinase 1 [Octopus sinensis]|uniref:Digestive cysteine proteinase 1 n=1 Tax=Octopus sinensis TaxID=2607531 RepID=A0A6P7SLT3_9MOLL|nr:digestive cysteine proteinase 1 [Octopus sinensis]